VTAEFVIDAYHRLFQIEKSFRMSKHDLQARPIYHHQRDSIEAHLTIVFAALAVGRWIEHRTGWSIKKFIRTARRYRTIDIQAGAHTIPPPICYPTTSATPSKPSPEPADMRTNLSQVGSRPFVLAALRALRLDPAPAVEGLDLRWTARGTLIVEAGKGSYATANASHYSLQSTSRFRKKSTDVSKLPNLQVAHYVVGSPKCPSPPTIPTRTPTPPAAVFPITSPPGFPQRFTLVATAAKLASNLAVQPSLFSQSTS